MNKVRMTDFNRLFISLLIICISVLLPVNNLYSQTNTTLDWEEIAGQMVTDEEGEEKDMLNQLNDLQELKEHPLNINTITKEQLEAFPFLTDIQIEHILYYLYVSGPMQTIYELQLVEDMDRQTIQYLIPFIYVGEKEKEENTILLKSLLKYGKQEVITRLDIPLNRKEGYQPDVDNVLITNPNKRYIGASFYHSFRYSFRYKDRISFGLTAEKDAGEPFFVKGNKKGYDFYSFYFLVCNLKHLKALAVGNYRLSFGQGLVMNTDYSLGKSSSVSTIGSKSAGIKKHSSTDEYNYFRGIATSYQIKDWVLSAFYSHRKLDAIVENELITSLKKDGMHRIVRDFEKKNQATNQLIGSNLTYYSQCFQLGVTAVYNFFNYLFIPEVKPYSVFYPQGKNFFNLGVDYKYRWSKFYFFGESAIGKGGGVATLNVIRFAPVSGYQILLLQRYYAKDYRSFYARSVSEGSGVQNENGWYFGIEGKPMKYWKFFVYADFFRFPWLRYGVDKPSSGFDGLVEVTYSPKKNLTMFARYRYKVKDKNYKDEERNIRSVLPYIQQKLRYQLGYVLQDNLSLRTTLDLTWIHPEGVSVSKGFMLVQTISYALPSLPLKIDLHYALFDTDDYASRLTSYERGVLYAFSMPSFYGQGVRFALNVRYDFNEHLMLITKYSQTKYNDREEIGTGLEMIKGNKKADINVQLRYKF